MQKSVEQDGMIEGVLADQRWREVVRNNPEGSETALHWGGLANTG
jgi:hypothetical protein